MVKNLTKGICEFGPKTVLLHAWAKLGGNPLAYELCVQEHYSKFSLEQRCCYVNKVFAKSMGYPLDLCNPRTFCEKIQWLKLYDATPEKTRLSDKYLVRDYVAARVGESYLVPLCGVWDSFDEIDLGALPNQFVLKANHGSGMNLIVKDKNVIDIVEAKRRADIWMKLNYAFQGNFEMQYRDIPPKLIVEEYIEQSDGNLHDYKIHCFGGVPHCVQLIGDRDFKAHTGKQAFLDIDHSKMPFSFNDYPEYEKVPPRPDNWDEVLDVAARLSRGFSYVRVDLYSVREKVYFGEMTFTPANGLYPKWRPREYDRAWGDMIELPDRVLAKGTEFDER